MTFPKKEIMLDRTREFVLGSRSSSTTPLVDNQKNENDNISIPPLINNIGNNTNINIIGHCNNIPIRGIDFNDSIFMETVEPDRLHTILNSFPTTGFQATNLGKAIKIARDMLEARHYLSIEPKDPTKYKLYLGYTSNLSSSGLRDIIKWLCQHHLVDVIVTSAGGVEEDLIKCLGNTLLGDFNLKGSILRERGMNRVGNLLIPNNNYCLFEDWLMPILDTMAEEQITKGTKWTPSKLINRLGKEINNEDSICYWAWRNNIPIFSPALTDGSLGDMLYFHSYRDSENPLILDIVQDLKLLNNSSVFAQETGMIILGGGLVKHHICNANLMRNGAEKAIYINTGQEFDGSDSGASPDEAVSWGKIKPDADMVKVCCDATIAFPLLVAESFSLYHSLHLRKTMNSLGDELYI